LRRWHLLAALAIAGAVASPCAAVELSSRRIEVDGRQRTYLQYLPENADEPRPLVLVFHGGGSSGIAAARLTGFAGIAQRERFAVVFPDAWQRHWNDGREAPKLASQRAKVNDVAFVSALLDAVGSEMRFDPRRVFATG